MGFFCFQDGFTYNQGPNFGGKNHFGNFPPAGDLFFQVLKHTAGLFQFVWVTGQRSTLKVFLLFFNFF